jgi:hypothetical protein
METSYIMWSVKNFLYKILNLHRCMSIDMNIVVYIYIYIYIYIVLRIFHKKKSILLHLAFKLSNQYLNQYQNGNGLTVIANRIYIIW